MRTLRWVLLLALGLLVPRIAERVPGAVERVYARGLFPRFAGVLSSVTDRIRFSLAQLLVVAGLAILIFALARGVRRSIRMRSLRGFGPAWRWAAAAAILVWSFHLLWGLNYGRPTLYKRLAITRIEPDPERLARLTRLLAAEVNRTWLLAATSRQIEQPAEPNAESGNSGRSGHSGQPGAGRADSAGPGTASADSGRRTRLSGSRLLVSRADVAARIDAAYRVLLPAFRRVSLTPPKFPAVSSWAMTRVGISGFYFPYTGEAHVDGEMPDASIPFVMAHEMAHQRGTAREEEANFWAYLACTESSLAAARYSGALEAFGLAWDALNRAAPDSARAMAPGLLTPGPRADRAAIRAFWERHQNPAMKVSDKVNDAYLKTNAQTAGVESYGLAVDLMVALEAAGRLPVSELPRP